MGGSHILKLRSREMIGKKPHPLFGKAASLTLNLRDEGHCFGVDGRAGNFSERQIIGKLPSRQDRIRPTELINWITVRHRPFVHRLP